MKKKIAIILAIMIMVMPLSSCSKWLGLDESDGTPGTGNESADYSNEVDEEEEEEEIEEDDWDPDDQFIPDDEAELGGKTLEDRLAYLKRDGWKLSEKKTYVFTTDDDDCKGTYTITAKENDAVLTVDFDYGLDNTEMLNFYKDDKNAARAICAYWYFRATDATGILEGTVKYTLTVGDKNVAEGQMTYEQADEAYTGYFSD